MKPLYTTIPIMLIKHAKRSRRINHLKLFLYLKHNSDGEIDFDTSNYKHYAEDLNMSERWVREAFKWLINERWITINKKRNVKRIISYKKLCNKLNIYNYRSAIYENEDFNDFKEFCCGAIIAYEIRVKQYIEKKERSVSKMGDATTNHSIYQKGFYTLPINYLALRLKISPTNANNMKIAASKFDYIDIKSQIITLEDGNGNKLLKNLAYSFKKANPEIAGRVRCGKKYLKLVEADIMRSEIILKYKRL